MSECRIIQGDCLERLRELSGCSVHCCVTSPPYFSLRDYGVEGQIGLEDSPQAYVEKIVAVFREVRRVLRDDATCWLNLGDSYAAGKCGRDDSGNNGRFGGPRIEPKQRSAPDGLKPKDLVGIPWMTAFVLRADGWYLRSDIIWHKPNPMPESVTDRPTKAHEYLFLLAKSQTYYYDADAVAEEADPKYANRYKMPFFAGEKESGGNGRPGNACNTSGIVEFTGKRNRRSVWTIPTQSYKGAHFATYPEDLVEPCILAGTSERGCCASCGAPWERMVERVRGPVREVTTNGPIGEHRFIGGYRCDSGTEVKTLGWQPSCECNADCIPCSVLDPFCGSGTTLLVARKLGRSGIGIELNADYIELAHKRIGAYAPLFGESA